MAIRITRNDAGNCINFVGSSNPSYWNACLSAVINSENDKRVDIINDIRSENEDEIQYEFYAVEFTDFADKDNNQFTSAQAMVDYINENANVIGVSGIGADLTDTVVNFRLDQTTTSIIMDNGSEFGVNTIKAVADVDGTIHIHAIGAGVPSGEEDAGEHKHFQKLDHTNVQINGVAAVGGLNDVVNALNELFTVGPFEAVVISDPYATRVADQAGVPAGYTLEGIDVVDPAGDDLATSTKNSHRAGIKSTATINQPGEFYTFQIRGEGQIGFGLIHTQASYDAGLYSGNATYADPAQYKVYNSQHGGFQFSHHFHPTPNGPWTNYGANTSFSMRSGWSNATDRFISSDEGADWLAGNPVKIKVGLDENSYISIDYYNAAQGRYIPISRSGYPVPQGSEYHLGVSMFNPSARLYSAPKVHLLEEEAPAMYFRYIESPDGNFEYPLFATAEEANYYDEQAGGSGTSHTHTYDDDPTFTTWYMPSTGATMTGTSAPTGDAVITDATYTEITSRTNADLTPTQFSNADLTYEEGTAVNIQLQPADTTYTTSVSISPVGSGLVYDTSSRMLQGTLADVASDTTYTITVTRANSYGSSVGSFDITATNVAPTNTMTTSWNRALDFSGGSERAEMVSASSSANPLQMGGGNNQVSAPAAGQTTSAGHPWATAIVFRPDGNPSNQHIWNYGEGAGSTDDNIYLRLDAGGNLYFGMGRSGDYNEVTFGNGFNANVGTRQYWGIYIAHNGTRYGTGSTAEQLAAAFDIRIMNYAGGTWQFAGAGGNFADAVGNRSTVTNWSRSGSTTGGRMNRVFGGQMSIGGRGSNRNFHGKVASMVVTTLLQDVAMPTDAEIIEMVTDPMDWLANYKVGNAYRLSSGTTEYSNFAIDNYNSALSTQVWLMGDGANDSYSNMIRNRVQQSDQNYTKLNLISMVSNDIQTVSIPGLT